MTLQRIKLFVFPWHNLGSFGGLFFFIHWRGFKAGVSSSYYSLRRSNSSSLSKLKKLLIPSTFKITWNFNLRCWLQDRARSCQSMLFLVLRRLLYKVYATKCNYFKCQFNFSDTLSVIICYSWKRDTSTDKASWRLDLVLLSSWGMYKIVGRRWKGKIVTNQEQSWKRTYTFEEPAQDLLGTMFLLSTTCP